MKSNIFRLSDIEDKNIITVSKGKQLPKEERGVGDIVVIGAGKKSPYTTSESNYGVDTITISSSGAYAGYISKHNYPIWASDCTVIEIADEKELDKNYFYLFLLSKQQLIYSFQSGAGQPHVYWKNVKNIEIPLPPLPKQKAIAQKLDLAQKLITLRKESIEKLDVLAKSVFVEMFGDPVENPMGWEVKTISELGKVQTGNTPPRKDVDNYGEYIEWIKSDNIIKDKKYLTQSREKLSEKGYKKGRVVAPDSLLFTCIAGSMSSIGNLAVVDREVTFNQQINSLTPENDNIDYLYGLFKLMKRYFEENSSKSMKIMINKSTFENLTFPIAPLELQNKFAQTIQQIEIQKALYEKELVKLQESFDGLLAEHIDRLSDRHFDAAQ